VGVEAEAARRREGGGEQDRPGEGDRRVEQRPEHQRAREGGREDRGPGPGQAPAAQEQGHHEAEDGALEQAEREPEQRPAERVKDGVLVAHTGKTQAGGEWSRLGLEVDRPDRPGGRGPGDRLLDEEPDPRGAVIGDIGKPALGDGEAPGAEDRVESGRGLDR
jgi:hypothetical protein